MELDSADFGVSDLPDLRACLILKFLDLNLQKWISPLRSCHENTWDGHRIHLDRSPEELD